VFLPDLEDSADLLAPIQKAEPIQKVVITGQAFL
jgi:hypothetical protein